MLKKHSIRRNVRYQVPCTGTVPPNSTAKVHSASLTEDAFIGDQIGVFAQDAQGSDVSGDVFLGILPGAIKRGERLSIDVTNKTNKNLTVVVTVIGWVPVAEVK